MLVIRYLAGVSLMSALVAGCSQSLFDVDPGRDDGGPPRHDASAPGDGPGRSDGGPGEPDGGPGDRDGGPDLQTDDAVADFSLARQGGVNGRWNYMELRLGAVVPPVFQPMVRGSRLAMFEAWVGAGEPSPAIVPCAMYGSLPAPYAPCAGVGDRLLLEIADTTGQVPVLQWTAPATGVYRLRLDARIPDAYPGEAASYLSIARNGQFDMLNASLPADTFDIDVELIERDTVLLIATTEESPPVPVGVGLTIEARPEAEEACRLALRFDGESGDVQNLCGDLGSFVEGGVATQPGDASLPPGVPGSARQFVTGSSLQYDGAALDYSQPFTVQFWARLDGMSSDDQWLLSDLDCDAKGGVAVSVDPQGQLVFEMAAMDTTDYCTARSTYAASFTAPLDGTWHFYRMAWNASLLTVCKDGVAAGITQARDLEPGAARVLTLGRRDGRPGSFQGQLADVRVFAGALPCP